MFFHFFFFFFFKLRAQTSVPDCFPLKYESGVSRSCKAFLVFKVFFKAHLEVGRGLYGGFATVCEILLEAPEGLRFQTWTDSRVNLRARGGAAPRGNRVRRERRKNASPHRLFIYDQVPSQNRARRFPKESQMF